MERVVILRRLSFVVLTVAVGFSACRATQDPKEEGSPAEEIAPATEEPASNPEATVAEAAEGEGASAEPEALSPRAAQQQTPPPQPPARAVGQPAKPEPTAPPAARQPAPEAAPPFPVPAPPAARPPEPEILEVTLPAGTVLELELLTPLDTFVSRVGDEIEARTLSPVYLEGEPILPRGTYVEGRVTEVTASGRVKGRARLAFTFDRLSTRSGLKEIRTSYVSEQAQSRTKTDAGVIGGAAGIGALMGGIIGGKKGAAIGATIGGVGGTGVVLATKGEEIRLPVGTEVNVRLDEPVVLQLN